jgi:hypothetical protein
VAIYGYLCLLCMRLRFCREIGTRSSTIYQNLYSTLGYGSRAPHNQHHQSDIKINGRKKQTKHTGHRAHTQHTPTRHTAVGARTRRGATNLHVASSQLATRHARCCTLRSQQRGSASGFAVRGRRAEQPRCMPRWRNANREPATGTATRQRSTRQR